MNNTAHRITIQTRFGAKDIVRIYGEQDQDMAVIKLQEAIGDCSVKYVETINANADFIWGEQPLM